MKTAIVIMACMLCCSCAVLRQQSDWTDQWPSDTASPWARCVDVAFTNVPLPQVVAELERLANVQTGPKLSLGLGQIPSGPWNEDPFTRVTFTATNVPVVDAFRIIGDVASCRAMFRGLEGILAEHFHGHREGTIFLTGRCVDAATGQPLEAPSISRYFAKIELREDGTFLRAFRVEGTTDFFRCDGKNYLMKTELLPQNIRFVVTAPGYQPQEFSVSTQGSMLTYTNNIEMKKDIPTTE